MSSTFLSKIYGMFVNPFETMDNLKKLEEPPVFEAFSVVVAISIIGGLNQYEGNSLVLLPFSLITYVIFSLVSWVFVAAIIDGLATVFAKKQNFDVLMVLTAFSLVPWIFMGPIEMFKSAGFEGIGIIGYLLGIILAVFLWFWTTVLFLSAVSKAYDFSGGKALLLTIMPFLGSIIAFFWFVGFITNFINILQT